MMKKNSRARGGSAGGREGGPPLFSGWLGKVAFDKVTFEQRSKEEGERGWRSVGGTFQIKRTAKAEALSGPARGLAAGAA